MGCGTSRQRAKSMGPRNPVPQKQVGRPVSAINPSVNTSNIPQNQNQNQNRPRQPSQKIHSSKIVEQVGVRSEVRKTTGSIITQQRSKAKLVFGANDTNSKPLQKPETLKPTQAFTIQDTVILNRQSDYCEDIKNSGKPPSLLAKKQLLTYQLDTEDGVSKTPLIHTFRYQTMLHHNISNAWNPVK